MWAAVAARTAITVRTDFKSCGVYFAEQSAIRVPRRRRLVRRRCWLLRVRFGSAQFVIQFAGWRVDLLKVNSLQGCRENAQIRLPI